MRVLHWVCWAVVCLGAMSSGGAASAQSTNAAPILIRNAAMVDPASLPLDDQGKKFLTDALANLASGTWLAHVVASSPDGKIWASGIATKGSPVNIGDVARQALESCEFANSNGPCVIFSIDGHDARDSDGAWPTQPRMLEVTPGVAFDAWRVPFVSLIDRSQIAKGYPLAAVPRAFVLSQYGGWSWNTGKTVFDAIATTFAACQKNYPGQTCILYAVNDNVVFAQ
jgi:hypothetical protein